MATAFIDYDVVPINIGDTDVLHLKDAVNVIGREELVVAGGDGPRTIMKVGSAHSGVRPFRGSALVRWCPAPSSSW